MISFDKNPLVSVCIPTYRGATHLAATIDSVLGQSLENFELIIIDDNSPDTTEEVVSGYFDARIRYFRNTTNLGPEGNWNRCLQEARGRYFKLLPQDDILYSDTLLQQVKVLEQDKENRIALVFGARNIVDFQGKIITRRGYPGGREGSIDGIQLIRLCIRRGTNLIGEPGNVLMRKVLADKVGSFNGDFSYVIDLDYWVRLLVHGDGYYLAGPMSAFRISPGSWSVAIGSRQNEDVRNFIDRIAGLFQIDLSETDVLLGKLRARINNILRILFYFYVLKVRS